MAKLLDIVKIGSRKGEKAVARLTSRSGEVLDAKLVKKVDRIVRAVRDKGDRALLDAVRRYDHPEAAAAGGGAVPSAALEIRVQPEGAGPESPLRPLLPPGLPEALDRAIAAVEAFHRRQLHPGFTMAEGGVTLEERRQPFRRVAVYVPGGLASYFSTAVMTVVPARVAGVEEVVAVTPPLSYRNNAAVRYTLARLGVDEIWGMGGAHAVAALAYGTETVRRVDKIVGPGNAWVTAAKRQVAGDVAIDGLAGPTEVLVVADGGADPALVAADLLAQAEHDARAAAILVTDDKALAKAVDRALVEQLDALATAVTARASLRSFGTAFVVPEMAAALELVEALAPEHLQLVGARAEALADRVRSAGAIFLGAATPEVFGDYVAGPSHVLPTGGSARFASALGVEDFVRRSHVVRYTPAAAAAAASTAALLAEAEGLPAHAAAARRRGAPAVAGGAAAAGVETGAGTGTEAEATRTTGGDSPGRPEVPAAGAPPTGVFGTDEDDAPRAGDETWAGGHRGFGPEGEPR